VSHPATAAVNLYISTIPSSGKPPARACPVDENPYPRFGLDLDLVGKGNNGPSPHSLGRHWPTELSFGSLGVVGDLAGDWAGLPLHLRSEY
jgi:hypothetical protein